jgi:hypothetical protein
MPSHVSARARDAVEASAAGRLAKPWVSGLARAGFVAHGLLYVTIAALAVMVATGGGRAGERMDSKGALRELHHQPFGKVLLVLMTIGLLGYALWRFVEAALDPEREARGVKGFFKRVGWALGGAIHAALVVYGVGLISGTMLGGAGDGQQAKSWSARLIGWEPWGAWILGAVGVVLLATAVHQGWKAACSKLDERLDLRRVGPRLRRIVVDVSRFGIAARALVAALVGVGLIVAAFHADARRVQGVAEALDAVRHREFGPALLLAVAFGLGAYGVYELIEARYRRIRAI